ncbi:MAG TPA: ABC transporter permease [Gemmatimonadaceae bacterium]
MSELRRAILSESLKIKRTLALRLAVLAPLFIVLLQTGVYLGRGEDLERARANPIVGFARGIVTLWTLVFLPFYATLAGALVAGLDHHEHHWEQLFALPVRRRSVYASKWFVVVGLVVVSSVLLPMFTVLAATGLKLVRHEWSSAAMPVGLLLNGPARSCAAALLLISVQFWFSLRWRSLMVPLAVGIAGIMSGIILITAPLRLLSVYPWTAPAAAASPNQPTLALVWGATAGLIVGAASCWRLARRG